MFKKIVVPVDGSESAWRALEQAAALAEQCRSGRSRTGSAGPRQRQSGCQRFYRQGGI